MLGHLLWFVVQDCPVETVQKEWSLPEEFLPEVAAPLKAFERATGYRVLHRYQLSDGRPCMAHFAAAARTDERVVRKMFREVRNPRNNTVHDLEVGEAILYRGGRQPQLRITLDATALAEEEMQHVIPWAEAVERAFIERGSKVTLQMLRQSIRDYLDSLHAVVLHSVGGVYFSPAPVDAPQRLVRALGGEFWSLGYEDTDESRELLRGRILAEISHDVDRVLIDLPKHKRRCSAELRRTLQTRIDHMIVKSELYGGLIDLPQEDTGTQILLAQRSLDAK